MHTPPRLFAHSSSKLNANYYYRVTVPTMWLERAHKAQVYHGAPWEHKTAADLASYIKGIAVQDVSLFFAVGGKMTLKTFDLVRHADDYTEDGKKLRPSVLIADLDDNIDFVHPMNPVFFHLGTRLPDGTLLVDLLKKGDDALYIKLDATGEQVPLWQNGKDGFDIKRNWDGIRTLNNCLQWAHAVTFTTDRLRRYYVENYGLKETYVLPNSVEFGEYEDIRLAKDPGVVRVLWQGGSSHWQDLYPMQRTLEAASKQFPEVKWVFWTDKMYDWVTQAIPKDRIEWHPWIPYSAYKLKLSALDFDIAIAPLIGNVFNLGKSAIKWYEPSALPDPRACLMADVPPYCDEVEDGVTGELFRMPSHEELVSSTFIEKLGKLVRDEKHRKQVAANAKDWVKENRDIEVTGPKWWEWVSDLEGRWQSGRLQRPERAKRVRKVRPPVR